MKTSHPFPRRGPAGRKEAGMATLLFIILLGIMMVLILAESRSLIRLHREVKFMEQQQIKRLNGFPTPQTNAVSHSVAP